VISVVISRFKLQRKPGSIYHRGRLRHVDIGTHFTRSSSVFL
jgi:hypothetical protein